MFHVSVFLCFTLMLFGSYVLCRSFWLPWRRLSLNHSPSIKQDNPLGNITKDIATFVSQPPSFTSNSPKSYNVYQVRLYWPILGPGVVSVRPPRLWKTLRRPQLGMKMAGLAVSGRFLKSRRGPMKTTLKYYPPTDFNSSPFLRAFMCLQSF